MASPKGRLTTEMQQALRAGDRVRLGALRLLLASVKNREIELRRDLTDDEFVEVATKEIKRRVEAIEAYERAGREDRAAVEREEMAVLQAYVPPALTDEELDALIGEAIEATGASGPGDLGRVMGIVMGRTKGRADGRVVQERVRARLSGENGSA
jgi:uncharacterized protein YqeY